MHALLRVCILVGFVVVRTATALVCADADKSTLARFFLPEADYGASGGRCLDGSMADFYYKPGPGESTTWIIYMEGGGFCSTKAECQMRATSVLGTSTRGPTQKAGLGGLFCSNEAANPGFSNAHKLYIPYRSGDLHAGQRTTTYADWGVFFSGHLHLVHIIDHLKQRNSETNILNAAKVLLTGSSAGGIGTILNAEWFSASAFPNAVVKAAPVSGFFADLSDLNATYPEFIAGDTHPIPLNMSAAADVWDTHTPASCVTAVGNGNPPALCFFAPVSVPLSPVDFLVIESQFDRNPLQSRLGFPTDFARALETDEGRAYLRLYGDVNRAAHQRLDNVFSPSCFDHVSGFGVTSESSTSVSVDGQTVSANALIHDWFFEVNTMPRKIVEDRSASGLPGNPTCSSVDAQTQPSRWRVPACVRACLAGCGASADMLAGSAACACAAAACETRRACSAADAAAVSAALSQLCASAPEQVQEQQERAGEGEESSESGARFARRHGAQGWATLCAMGLVAWAAGTWMGLSCR
mmetsp:Transcript_21245/g.50337  ORF Transcript_21245/g.50337 Transcript_21245/m.50337 type:complete len:526 (-) Transcript_21245:25-1602(-)